MKRKSVRIYSFTGTGSCLALKLAEKLKQEGYVCTGYTVARFAEDKRLQRLNDGWKQEIGASWGEHALVFIGAAGIAVRMIAPHVKDKFTDSPVLVMDEKGSYVIPLLSGHVGGAVELAKEIAEKIDAQAVFTTATDVEQKEGTDTTMQGMEEICKKAQHSVKEIPFRQVITGFAGLRAHEDGHEFVIQEVEDAPGFIDCAGIESPGLTSAPAIGRLAAEIVRNVLELKENPAFCKTRKGILNPAELTAKERNELIRKNPAYGRIVCRCEMISEGEILDSIHRPLGATTMDGIKRRTRAGMGRCQAGFCTPKTMEILERELKIRQEEITKNGAGSEMIVGRNKDGKI